VGSSDVQRTLNELGLAEQTGLSIGLVTSLLDVAVALGLANRSDSVSSPPTA
jgi:hypothetical protein